jgi:hypothetical protein
MTDRTCRFIARSRVYQGQAATEGRQPIHLRSHGPSQTNHGGSRDSRGGRHSAPGGTRRRNSNDLKNTSNGRWMVAWSSPGSHLRRRTDRGRLPREVNRRSSQGLRHLVRVWRGEVGPRMPWNWTKLSDAEGQNGGRTFEAGARILSGGCNSAPALPLALFLYGRTLSCTLRFPRIICSAVFLLIHFVLL